VFEYFTGTKNPKIIKLEYFLSTSASSVILLAHFSLVKLFLLKMLYCAWAVYSWQKLAIRIIMIKMINDETHTYHHSRDQKCHDLMVIPTTISKKFT
jgi:hypothetical protein